MEEKTVMGILDLIKRERTGENVNRPLIRSLLRMFSALQVRPTRILTVAVERACCICSGDESVAEEVS